MSFHGRQLTKPAWPFALNHGSSQAQGLMAWYPMALPGGNALFDMSLRNAPGALTNGPTWGAGESGAAIVFDGSNDWVNLGNVGGTSTELTLVAEVYFSAVDTVLRTIMAKRNGQGSNCNWVMRKTSAGGGFAGENDTNLTFYHANGGAFKIWHTSGAGLVVNRWYQIVCTYDGASDPKFYLDAKSISGFWAATFVGPAALVSNTESASLGALTDASEPFSGRIGEARIYNRILSAGEVWALYDPQTRYDLYWELGRRASLMAIPSIAIAGSITPTGALIKQDQNTLTGSIAPTGSLLKQIAKLFSGAIAPAAALLKQIARAFSGGITPSGTLANIKVFLRSFAGAITPTGAIIKSAGKALTGSVTAAGAIIKSVARSLSGIITPVGAVLKQIAHGVSGSITPSGAVSFLKVFIRSFAGSIPPSGTLTRQIGKALGGLITPAAVIARGVSKLFSGILTLAGTVANIITGFGVPEIAATLTDSAVTTASLSDSVVTRCTLSDELGG